MIRSPSVVAILLLAGCSNGGREVAQAEGRFAELDDVLGSAVVEFGVPALEAVVFDREGVLYHEVFGRRHVEGGVPLEKGDLFDVASMTKLVTSVAVLSLVDEDRFALDDPAADYLPDLARLEIVTSFNGLDSTYTSAPPATPITIRHLLTHTSGLAYPWWDRRLQSIAAKAGDARTLHYDYRTVPLLHEPGEAWSYGVSARALGHLIEAVSGVRLDEFLRSRIFGPLGMEHTFFDIPEDLLHRRVSHHEVEEGAWVEQPMPERHEALIIGDGALISTGGDYARLLRMLLNGGALDGVRILSEASVRMIPTNQIGDLHVIELFNDFPRGAGRDRFGLGAQVASGPLDPGLRSEGSYSWGGSYNTFFWVDPSEGIGAVLMMHYVPFNDDVAQHILDTFERRIYGIVRGIS